MDSTRSALHSIVVLPWIASPCHIELYEYRRLFNISTARTEIFPFPLSPPHPLTQTILQSLSLSLSIHISISPFPCSSHLHPRSSPPRPTSGLGQVHQAPGKQDGKLVPITTTFDPALIAFDTLAAGGSGGRNRQQGRPRRTDILVCPTSTHECPGGGSFGHGGEVYGRSIESGGFPTSVGAVISTGF